MIFVDDGGGCVCPCNLVFFFSTAAATATAVVPGICLSKRGVGSFSSFSHGELGERVEIVSVREGACLRVTTTSSSSLINE